MITMVDEIYDRSYQAGRAALNKELGALVRGIGNAIVPALSALHHFEWDAPWTARDDRKAKA
jgi:hypothetical protein